MTTEKILEDFQNTIANINIMAKAAYKASPGHRDDIAHIGMVAEGAIARIVEYRGGKPYEGENLKAFEAGMEAAALVAVDKGDYQTALEIRREIRNRQIKGR